MFGIAQGMLWDRRAPGDALAERAAAGQAPTAAVRND
jgi:hypothetical protein